MGLGDGGGGKNHRDIKWILLGVRLWPHNIPFAAAVKVSFVRIHWQGMLSVTKFIDCLSI